MNNRLNLHLSYWCLTRWFQSGCPHDVKILKTTLWAVPGQYLKLYIPLVHDSGVQLVIFQSCVSFKGRRIPTTQPIATDVPVIFIQRKGSLEDNLPLSHHIRIIWNRNPAMFANNMVTKIKWSQLKLSEDPSNQGGHQVFAIFTFEYDIWVPRSRMNQSCVPVWATQKVFSLSAFLCFKTLTGVWSVLKDPEVEWYLTASWLYSETKQSLATAT